ncbi:MAG: SAM-dependent methyltransferase [Micromonosporaceae bacterium]|nr:SAM-dependent methyltransferase [Micromonosporaceae bacterium]
MTPEPDDPFSIVGLDQPNAARIYDCLLGGGHSFAADRAAADQLVQAVPGARDAARANRAFLARAVRYAIGYDIIQFLDLGAGIPAAGSTHEVARRLTPHARVVYVDRDPVAVTCAEQLLDGDPYTGAVQSDLRDIHTVLADAVTTRLLDFTQPVAVLMVAVLHFVPGDAASITRTLADVLPPGSLLIISHSTAEPTELNDPTTQLVTSVYAGTPTPLCLRSRTQILDLFDGFALAGPGLVTVDQWRPETNTTDPPIPGFLAGVGHRERPPATVSAPRALSRARNAPHIKQPSRTTASHTPALANRL